MSFEYQTLQLTQSAKKILELPQESDVDQFLELVDSYMIEFTDWFALLEKTLQAGMAEEELSQFKALLTQIAANHQRVLDRSEASKAEVKQAMSELHKRGNALKTYIDVRPDRISITGKREG